SICPRCNAGPYIPQASTPPRAKMIQVMGRLVSCMICYAMAWPSSDSNNSPGVSSACRHKKCRAQKIADRLVRRDPLAHTTWKFTKGNDFPRVHQCYGSSSGEDNQHG